MNFKEIVTKIMGENKPQKCEEIEDFQEVQKYLDHIEKHSHGLQGSFLNVYLVQAIVTGEYNFEREENMFSFVFDKIFDLLAEQTN